MTGCHVLGRTNTKGTSQSESLSHLKLSFVCASHSRQGGPFLSFRSLNTLAHKEGTNIFPMALGFTLRGAIKHAISAFPCQKHRPPSKHSHMLHSSHTVSDSHVSFMISNIRPAVSRRELTHTCEIPTITRKSSPIEGKV